MADTVNFNGAHGCMKCKTEGIYSHISNTVIFPNLNAAPRTNESFRNKDDAQHHHGETPLTDLPLTVDLVEDIVIGDELHLLHLGLIKRFLNGWRSGSLGLRTKWSKSNEKEIDDYILSSNKPFEIHRKMRGLNELARWKGTEFRTFLLYTSLPVLKKFLPPKYFQHYLLFYCAIVIFGSQYFCDKLYDIANQMIQSFLSLFKTMYGIHHFTSNLHNLSHLAEEVKRFGVLGNFNTYSFENKLQGIKSMVRSGNRPLKQICKRLLEEDFASSNEYCNLKTSVDATLSGKIDSDCEAFKRYGKPYKTFKRLQTADFRIECSKNDKWVLTTEREIIAAECFVRFDDNKCFFYGSAIIEKEPFFTTPISSDALLIYVAQNKLKSAKLYPIENISCKLFQLKYFGVYNEKEIEEDLCPFDSVFIPLWHTLK